jgi:CubicO group peptidase (beta-lactamase class C family)
MLATIYRASGAVGRSVSTSKTLHSPEKPGANGTYFAGGLTTSSYDVAKLIAMLAGDGMYEGVQLMDPESIAIMETYIETPVPGGSYQAHPMRLPHRRTISCKTSIQNMGHTNMAMGIKPPRHMTTTARAANTPPRAICLALVLSTGITTFLWAYYKRFSTE